jgi:hypothetical protein
MKEKNLINDISAVVLFIKETYNEKKIRKGRFYYKKSKYNTNRKINHVNISINVLNVN